MAIEPGEVQIREQLERLLTSAELGSSPRKQKFLKYVVEKTLSGEGKNLKGYAIGVDVFDRGEDFDSQQDTIVRVQARNLRKALEHHYLTAGLNDPVKIELKKGSYIPIFSVKENNELPEEINPTPVRSEMSASKSEHYNNRRLLLAALAAIGALIFIILLLLRAPA